MENKNQYIAVDGLGGDFAPHAVIEGVIEAAKKGVPILLYGPDKKMTRTLSELDSKWKKLPITVVHAPEEVGMSDEPVMAIRKKSDSSLVQAVKAVAEKKAAAVFSAGNSGAFMTAAFFLLGRQEGIERPAIAGILPTLKGSVVVLDLGANVDCRPHFLQQFAEMGSAYAKEHFGLTAPRVATLSNGTEQGKGSQLVKQTALLLEESSLNYVGNVEPADIIGGATDVVVCDGFSGNILLKTMEATAGMVKHAVSESLTASGIFKKGEAQEAVRPLLDTALRQIEKRFGEAAQSGARLLGVNGIVMVGHGSSHAISITNALIKAHEVVSAGT